MRAAIFDRLQAFVFFLVFVYPSHHFPQFIHRFRDWSFLANPTHVMKITKTVELVLKFSTLKIITLRKNCDKFLLYGDLTPNYKGVEETEGGRGRRGKFYVKRLYCGSILDFRDFLQSMNKNITLTPK